MAAISPTVSTGPYTANGTQTAFSFNFSIVGAADIIVRVDGTAASPLFYTVIFTATGGTVTFTAPPAPGAQVLLLSAPDYLQTSEFENEGGYNLTTINTINRRASIKALVTEDKANRALKMPRGQEGPEIPLSDVASIVAVGENLRAGNDIPTVAGAIEDVSMVADNMSVVSGVFAGLAAILAVGNDLLTANTIGAVSAKLAELHAIYVDLAGLEAIQADLTKLEAIHADLAKIEAVHADLAKLEAIYGDLAKLAAIHADLGNLDAVYAGLSAINTAAANVAAIIDAPNQAAIATAAAASLSGAYLVPSLTKAANRVAPPPIISETKGQTIDTVTAALSVVWIDEQNPATLEGFLTSASAKLTTALVGRTIEFYIMRAQGGGDYKVIWRSGTIAAANAGVTTQAFTPADNALMAIGDVRAVWCSAAASADGISYSSGSGFSCRRSGAAPSRLTVGSNIGAAYTTATNIRPQLSFTTVSLSLLLTTDWQGTPFGVAPLDSAARVKPVNALFGGGDVRTSGNSAVTTEGGEYVARPLVVDVTTTIARETTGAVATFNSATTLITIFYKGATPGFANSGYLNEIRLEAGSNIPANCMLQVWVVRPTTTPPVSTSGGMTVSLVAKVGTFDLSSFGATASAPAINIKGLLVRVQAGDMLAFRGPAGFGYFFGSGTGYSDDFQQTITIANDMTIDALNNGATTTNSGTNRRLLCSYRVVDAPYLAITDGPYALARTDSSGNLPANVATAAALPLRNLKIAWTGSSISTVAGGGNATDTGHVVLATRKLQCASTYLAIGGSYVQWNPSVATSTSTEYQTIGATQAELVARFPGGSGGDPGQWSYERRLIGQGFHGVVLPDGINDTNLGTLGGVGVWGDTTPNTYYGVMTRLIEALYNDNPAMLIWLQTPFHRWATYSTPGAYPTEQTNREAYRAAAYDLSEKYGCRGVLDYIGLVQVNRITVRSGNGLYDTIHPMSAMKVSAGQMIYSIMNQG